MIKSPLFYLKSFCSLLIVSITLLPLGSCAPKKLAKANFEVNLGNLGTASSGKSFILAVKDPLSDLSGDQLEERLLRFDLGPSDSSILVPLGEWFFFVIQTDSADWSDKLYCGKSGLTVIDSEATIVSLNVYKNNCLAGSLPYKKMLLEKGGTFFCPAGYVKVPENAILGVSAFCVMKFEAKDDGAANPVSQATSTPWNNINQGDAKSACTSLGARYDIVSNPERMAISIDIENTSSNWSGAAVGSGMLNRGHSDALPNNPIAVTDTSDPYNGTGNNAGQSPGLGWEQKRTHTLSNGSILWDFAGNVWERTDWSLGGGFTLGPISCPNGGYIEIPNIICGALAAADYLPDNPSGQTAGIYNSTYGLGGFIGGVGGSAIGGGSWGDAPSSGVFALHLTSGPANVFDSTGFRCVYRP